MGARDEGRATAALEQLKSEGLLDGPGAGQVEWLHLNLILPSTTRAAAEDFMKRESRLDILSELLHTYPSVVLRSDEQRWYLSQQCRHVSRPAYVLYSLTTRTHRFCHSLG